MNRINLHLIYISKIAIFAVLIYLFIFLPTKASANDSFGWFASRVEYVDDSATANCSSNEASVEIVLVNRDTHDVISNSIGLWTVKVKKSKSDQTEILSKEYNNVTNSESICFNPVSNGFQVRIFDSTGNYKPFSSPTIFPDDSTDVSYLEAMRGSHFKAYVQLSPASESSKNVSLVSPPDTFIATSGVEFLVSADKLTSMYNVSEVNKIKLYLEHQGNNSLYTKTVNTNGGAGVRAVTAPSNIPDGNYLWSFHMGLDGESLTERDTGIPWSWSFGGIPVSGLPSARSLIVDSTPPTASIENFKIISDQGSTVTVSFDEKKNDQYAGLGNSIMHIYNVTDGYDFMLAPFTYLPYTTASTTSFVISSFEKDKTYRIYSYVEDVLNNATTTSYYEYTIPLVTSVPQVELYNENGITNGYQGVSNSSAWLYGTTTDRHINYFPVTDIGYCWSTSSTAINTTATSLLNNPTEVTCYTEGVWMGSLGASSFYYKAQNLPASSTVYFRMMAKNEVGWGLSPVGFFDTLVSPFDTTAGTPTLPTLSYLPPTYITPVSLNPNLRLTSAGYTPIHEYGICYSTDQDLINAIEPIKFNISSSTYDSVYRDSWNSNCIFYGAMPLTTNLPFSLSYPPVFSGLASNQDHYFAVFAVNDLGAGIANGIAKTNELDYLFKIYNDSNVPTIDIDTSDFNDTTDLYDKIEVQFAGIDDSFDLSSYCGHFHSSCAREIPYEVTLDIGNDLTSESSLSGIMKVAKRGDSPVVFGLVQNVEFNNIPIDTPVKITVKINEPDTTFPQSNTLAKEWSDVITLSNPNSVADSASDSGSDSGNPLDIDPQFTFSASPSLIRSGSTTTLEWNMLTTDIDCEVTGPSDFTSVNFNPNNASDPNVTQDPITGRSNGVVITNLIRNTQLFNLTCDNTYSVYSTTTRINVVGNPTEF